MERSHYSYTPPPTAYCRTGDSTSKYSRQLEISCIQPLEIIKKQHKWVLGPCEYTQEPSKYLLKTFLQVIR